MIRFKVKKLVGVGLCLAICLVSFTGCSLFNPHKTAPIETITFRLSDSQPAGYVTIEMDNMFAQEVSSKTHGRIHIKTYPAGQLGDEKSVVEQMQYGTIDACRVGVATLANYNNNIGVATLPYLFTSTDQMFKVLDGSVGDTLFKSLEDDSKLEPLVWTDGGVRNFYTTVKQIKTPEDLKGLKIRTQQSQAMMDMVSCFGATPMPSSQNDIYSALQSGVVDGAENNWSSYMSMSHYKVAKYLVEDEHSMLPEMIVFSQMSWKNLTVSDQKILKAAAKNAGLWERKQWLVDEAAAQNKAEAAGTIVTKITDFTPWQNAVKSLYDKHPEWATLAEKIRNTQ